MFLFSNLSKCAFCGGRYQFQKRRLHFPKSTVTISPLCIDCALDRGLTFVCSSGGAGYGSRAVFISYPKSLIIIMSRKSLIAFYLSLACVSFSGCGGSTGDEIRISGVWDVTVSLSTNGCPSDAPIVTGLSYEHSVLFNSDLSQWNAVSVLDEHGDVFQSESATPTENSFIVTGVSHSLNPFINGASCRETIVWSYFNIAEGDGGAYSDNVGRNSLIDCTTLSGPISCNVYYSGTATRRP